MSADRIDQALLALELGSPGSSADVAGRVLDQVLDEMSAELARWSSYR